MDDAPTLLRVHIIVDRIKQVSAIITLVNCVFIYRSARTFLAKDKDGRATRAYSINILKWRHKLLVF